MAAAVQALAPEGRVRRDVWFAVGIIAILAVLFLPVPAVLTTLQIDLLQMVGGWWNTQSRGDLR